MTTPFVPSPRLWSATAFLLLALVVYLSLAPTGVQLPGDEGGRYGHVAAYAALMFMYVRMYETPRGRLLIGVTLVLMGIGLECAQGATSYRTFEYADMLANTIGVAVGWLAQRTVSMIAVRRTSA